MINTAYKTVHADPIFEDLDGVVDKVALQTQKDPG